MKKGKFIGLVIASIDSMKPEYRKLFDRKTRVISGTIRTDKTYGAKIVLDELGHAFRLSLLDGPKLTAKQRKLRKARIEKRLADNRAIDTSKWVRPDDRSLKRALIENLFGLELTMEGTCEHSEFEGRAQTLMQILNQKSPKNPQSLGPDYAILEPLVQVLAETKPKLRQEEYSIIFSGQTWGKHTYPGKRMGLQETRGKVKAWRNKIRAGMITVRR